MNQQNNLKIVHLADEKQREIDRRGRELGKLLLEKWNREAPAKWEKRKQFLANKKAPVALNN